MSVIQTIQEYLVSIGFDVDKTAFTQANTALNHMGKGVQDLGKKFQDTTGITAFDKRLNDSVKKIHDHVQSVRKAGEALQKTTLFNKKPQEKKPWFMGMDEEPANPKPLENNPHVKKIKDAVNTVGGSLKKVGGILESIFGAVDIGAVLIGGAVAGLAVLVLGFVAKIAFDIGKAIVGFMDGVAQAETRVRKLSLSLFISRDNARSLQETMDAIGLKSMEDLKFIALDPEKRKQFMDLSALSRSLKPSPETQDGLRNIRMVGVEFQKLGIIMNAFWRNLVGELGILIGGPLMEIIRIVGKLFDIAFKLVDISARLMGLGKLIPALNGVFNLITFVLDQIDKLLGVLDNGLDLGKGVAGNLQSDPLRAMAYYAMKIYEFLRDAWSWVVRFIDSIPSLKQMQQKAHQTTQQLAKNAIDAHNPNSETSKAMKQAWDKLLPSGFLHWGTKDSSSPEINRFRASLGKGLGAYQITAGMSSHGHEPHGDHPRGLAFDIGLGGKSEASIVALVKRTIATKGWRILDLELSHAKYARVLSSLQNQGISTRGIVNEPGRYRTGDNLHVGLQPITQHNTIHVHGKNADETAKAIENHLKQRARQGYRWVPA